MKPIIIVLWNGLFLSQWTAWQGDLVFSVTPPIFSFSNTWGLALNLYNVVQNQSPFGSLSPWVVYHSASSPCNLSHSASPSHLDGCFLFFFFHLLNLNISIRTTLVLCSLLSGFLSSLCQFLKNRMPLFTLLGYFWWKKKPPLKPHYCPAQYGINST